MDFLTFSFSNFDRLLSGLFSRIFKGAVDDFGVPPEFCGFNADEDDEEAPEAPVTPPLSDGFFLVILGSAVFSTFKAELDVLVLKFLKRSSMYLFFNSFISGFDPDPDPVVDCFVTAKGFSSRLLKRLAGRGFGGPVGVLGVLGFNGADLMAVVLVAAAVAPEGGTNFL